MTARFLVVPSLLSIAALVGCAGGDDLTEKADARTQLGTRVVPAESTRTPIAPPDWKVIEEKIDGLRLPQNILDFTPVPGTYSVDAQIIHEDECGADPAAFPPIDHGIRNINKRTGVYLTDYIDQGEVFETLSCELNGHFYRCDSSVSAIDFGLFGMEAVVFIENGDFGTWSGQTDTFLGLNPYTVRCEGRDCGEEPAASVFGLISRPMPCTGIDGQRFLLRQ